VTRRAARRFVWMSRGDADAMGKYFKLGRRFQATITPRPIAADDVMLEVKSEE
jgi:hypothetical protein